MSDLIVTLMITILTVALIPTVINQFRRKASTMPLTTTIPSMIALTGLLYVYIDEGWWLSVGITVINYILWLILTFQRWEYSSPVICQCAFFRDWDNEEDAVYDDL